MARLLFSRWSSLFFRFPSPPLVEERGLGRGIGCLAEVDSRSLGAVSSIYNEMNPAIEVLCVALTAVFAAETKNFLLIK